MAEDFDFEALVSALISPAMASGLFDRVNGAEPKNAPGSGVTGAVWLVDIRPLPNRSGLASTTVLIPMMFRIYMPSTSEPADAIDPKMYRAIAAVIRAYSGDFDLGGLIQEVDLLGSQGVPFRAVTGWLKIGDAPYRIAEITVPLIVNDVFDQAE